MAAKITHFALKILVGANVVPALLMLLVGYSDRLHPTEHPLLASAGLVFPAFLLVNFCFMVFFAFVKRRYVLVSFIGFVLAYEPVTTYWPVNIPDNPAPGSIKVMSFNVLNFCNAGAPSNEPNPILDYILNSDADIVCLQEGVMKPDIVERVLPVYHYVDSARGGPNSDCLLLFSKYPILKKEHIKYESKGNLSAAFKLLIDKDTVTVVNNHFETSGLSKEDRAGFKEMVKGEAHTRQMKSESKRLIVKLGEAAKKRAPQADAVVKYIQHAKGSVILCGDFNDSPISYTHYILAKQLTDCYRATANGPGISYHHNAIFVRIDNIMCSDDWTPYSCTVDRSIGYSDHYPIYCWLKKSSNDGK